MSSDFSGVADVFVLIPVVMPGNGCVFPEEASFLLSTSTSLVVLLEYVF